MRHARHLALFLLCVSGCGVQIDLTREAEARQAVWSSYSEMTEAPDLLFITQAELNCNPGPHSGRMYGYREAVSLGAVSADGMCVTGQMFLGERTAQLALRDGDNFSTTSMAHEFYHAHRDAVSGDPDYEHLDPGFGERYGHSRGAVDIANTALVMLGL